MWSQPLHFSPILAVTTAGTGPEMVGAVDVLGTAKGEAETVCATLMLRTANGDAETVGAADLFGTAKDEAEVVRAAVVSRQTDARR